jgi:hypothetical protein
MNNQPTQTPDNLLDNDIPEKFKTPEGGLNTEALLGSYKELEKKLSQGAPKPNIPDTPDMYEIDVSNAPFEADPEINARLHQAGFTQEQAQEVYNLALEKLVPVINEMAAEFQADREVEKLINHYGGPEQWKEISRQLLAFGSKNLPADVLDNLASSYDGVLALEKMMQTGEPGLAVEADGDTGAADEKELQSMMRDPRYWKSKDPAFVAKVTKGFKELYG